MLDVMLDLETMGTQPDAAIVAIGAVEFDLEANQLGRRFYQPVTLDSASELGGTIEPATVIWWMQKSEAARAELWRPDAAHIAQALRDFRLWLGECDSSVRVWGNGAAFDNVVLRSAYQRTGLDAPWQFRNDRCYRTVRGMFPTAPPMQRLGTHHNALNDAESQALHLLAMISKPADTITVQLSAEQLAAELKQAQAELQTERAQRQSDAESWRQREVLLRSYIR